MELSQKEMETWRNNPTTKKYFKYLNDYRLMLADSMASYLYDGILIDHENLKECALRCEILKDIEDVEFDDIENFYKEEEKE